MLKIMKKYSKNGTFLITTLVLVCVFTSCLFTKRTKPNIVILATGGTIAGKADSKTAVAGYTSGQLSVQDLLSAVPGATDVANIKGEQISNIDSQDMNETVWFKLADRINKLLSSSNVDGIVVTHGTDTLEETAYFLNLTVKSKKPVVVVGSMRPATAISADGPLNLYNAIKVASSENSKNLGVLVTLNDDIMDARSVTKRNTSHVQTFNSRDTGPIGFIQNGAVRYYKHPIHKNTSETPFSVKADNKPLPMVDIIYGYAGIDGKIVDFAIQHGAKGIVVAGVGDGGLGKILTDALVKAQQQGIVIVRSTRVGSGIVTRNGDAQDDKLHFVAADNLNPQKARVLLKLALTKTKEPNKIQEMFYTY